MGIHTGIVVSSIRGPALQRIGRLLLTPLWVKCLRPKAAPHLDLPGRAGRKRRLTEVSRVLPGLAHHVGVGWIAILLGELALLRTGSLRLGDRVDGVPEVGLQALDRNALLFL